MKKSIFYVGLLVILSIPLFFSCSKDEGGTLSVENKNSFIYLGKLYDTPNCIIEFDMLLNGGKNRAFAVNLYSSSLTYDTAEWFTGQGDVIWFDLISNAKDSITEGIYSFNPIYDTGPGDIVNGAAFMNFDMDNDSIFTEVTAYDIGGGEVLVNRIDSVTYEFSYELILQSGRALTGHYRGKCLIDTLLYQ